MLSEAIEKISGLENTFWRTESDESYHNLTALGSRVSSTTSARVPPSLPSSPGTSSRVLQVQVQVQVQEAQRIRCSLPQRQGFVPAGDSLHSRPPGGEGQDGRGGEDGGGGPGQFAAPARLRPACLAARGHRRSPPIPLPVPRRPLPAHPPQSADHAGQDEGERRTC